MAVRSINLELPTDALGDRAQEAMWNERLRRISAELTTTQQQIEELRVLFQKIIDWNFL